MSDKTHTTRSPQSNLQIGTDDRMIRVNYNRKTDKRAHRLPFCYLTITNMTVKSLGSHVTSNITSPMFTTRENPSFVN